MRFPVMRAGGGFVTYCCLLITPLLSSPSPQQPLSSASELKAKTFIDDAEKQLEADAIEATFADWAYESNLTDANQKVQLAAAEKSGLLAKKIGKTAQTFDVSQLQDR